MGKHDWLFDDLKVSEEKKEYPLSLNERERFEVFLNDAIEDEEKVSREYSYWADWLESKTAWLEPTDGRVYFYVKEVIEKLRKIAKDEKKHESDLGIILGEVWQLSS